MPRPGWAALLGLVLYLALAGPAGGEPAPSAAADSNGGQRAPSDFYGVVTRWPSAEDPATLEQMRESGVGTIRFLVLWSRVEHVRDRYDWDFLDRRFAATREVGAAPLPFLYGFPPWLRRSYDAPLSHAEGRAEWKQFLRALVERYGPGGTLDASLPGYAPVRRWQIWNEPNLPWSLGMEQATPADYVQVLRDSAKAIHSVDPNTKLISAGLAPARKSFRANRFMEGVFSEYARRRRQPDFSQVSIHPYASRLPVSMRRLRTFSHTVRRAARGSSYRIVVGEVGWASRGGDGTFLSGTSRTQARKLSRAYRKVYALRERLNVSSMIWYAWENGTSGLGCSFCPYTGLVREDGTAKRALRRFRHLATR